MCILALAWRAHPRWRLVVAGNRDESHARPAAPLARWSETDHVIAGRDLQSGGTWLGVSEQGRFAVITNLRGYGVADPDRLSRGALVSDLLAGTGRYSDPAQIDLSLFNPFNLIAADGGGIRFLSNRPEDIRTTLDHGIYGLSNGALDEPWPKTIQLKSSLMDWIVNGATHPEALLDSLREEAVPEFGLRSAEPSDIPEEPPLSSIFIRDPVYGTRCSTVVAVDAQGEGVIIEQRFDASGEPTGKSRLAFSWPR